MGNGEKRKIASGLQPYYTLEQMQDQMVVCICNLRMRKLGGWESNGMVMCADTGDKCEFLRPPEGSVPGDLVYFEGYERKPLDVMPKEKKNSKNAWELVAPKLMTDDQNIGCYKEDGGKMIPFRTDKGVCKTDSMKNSIVK